MPTIPELSDLVGKLTRAMAVRAGLSLDSSTLFGLASGLDVGLTVVAEGTGASFSGLSAESAARIVRYCQDEAVRMEAVDAQVAIFYRAWAQILAETYLDTQVSGDSRPVTATTIYQPAAKRRFYQGLQSFRAVRRDTPGGSDSESDLARMAVLTYLGAYAFPECNLDEFKQILLDTLRPDFSPEQLEPLVDKAIHIAEKFRRPWEEPDDLREDDDSAAE